MSDRPNCPNCGAELPQGSPRNLCPRCLLREGLRESKSLARNGGPSASGAVASVLDSIAVTIGAVPHVLLRDTTPGEEPGPIVKPAGGDDADTSIRYRIDGEIARGGMGAVLKGRDPDLGRDVALKVLREDLRDNADMVRRFVEEAQIGGQLQHPGIVPIYELGTFGDKRPFFSMKLVKGHTLAQLLEDRKEPADDLPRFLSVFEAIDQTVAYAHARGVIHRDLKPSNVMVGSFGEVQVMDWGLAKVLPRGGVVDDAQAGKLNRQETVIATARSGSDDSDLSHAGSVMGTPSYMAPEQARGEVDRIDERADVFALGSILCEILTGEPAFIGRSSGEIQRKAALGDLADAMDRLDACGADSDLVALAKHCMAREPDDRPRHAGAVADRVTAYLAGVQQKLRRAALESVEERGRRRLTTVAAAAVIALGLAGGGGYAWVQQQRAERVARTARAVDDALADASRLRGEAQAAPPGDTTKWAEALSAAKRAEGLLAQGETDAPLRGRVSDLLTQLQREQADAAEKARRLETDRALLAELELVRGSRGDNLDQKRTDAAYTAVFRKAGLDLDTTEPAEAGKWLSARSEPIELTIYLDDWAYVRIKAGRAEADWRRLVAASRAADPDPWRDALRARMGSKDAIAVSEFQRLADDEKALDTQPAPSLYLLARQLKLGADDRERAARVLRRAVSRHPADFWARVGLAAAYGTDTDATSANEIYPRPEEAVRHLSAAVAIRPGSPMAHDDLACALRAQGKLDEALAEYREVIRLKPDDANAHNGLGNVLIAQGKVDEAVAEYREATRLKLDDAVYHSNLGNALRGQGKLDEALAESREAIRLKPDDANAHNGLGNVLNAQGKVDEAITEYREAIHLEPDLALAHSNLGHVLRRQKKLDEAIAEFRTAIRLKPDFAEAHDSLGVAYDSMMKQDEAMAEHREAIRLKPGYSEAHSNLGVELEKQGKLDEAIVEYREAIRLKPENPEAHSNLGGALEDSGKLDEAVAECRTAIRLKPDFAEAHNNLGGALRLQGKHNEAIAEYHEAIRIKPGAAMPHNNLGGALRLQGKHNEAIAEYREAIRIKPDLAIAHGGLGFALWSVERFDEGLAEYREAARLKPELAAAHNNLASALSMHPDPAKRDPAAALLHARKSTALQPRNRNAINTLAVAQYRVGLRDEAVASFQESMERSKGGDPYDWFFMAMIEHERGNAKEATRWFDKSVAWMKQQKLPDRDLLQAWTEAAKLLGRPGPEAPVKTPSPLPKEKP